MFYASCMRIRPRSFALVLVALLVACGPAAGSEDPTPTAVATAATQTAVPSTATVTVSPTPAAVRLDIRASRLTIPSLGIDAEVQPSQIIPDTSPPTPGCPPRPPGGETLSVPNQGIATPVDNLEGLENKAWIFGHSRWLNQPGLFYGLQDLKVGDEVIVDGVERRAGEPVTRRRFVVDSLYLSDIDSGDKLITATNPVAIPSKPMVILQTSVREDGAGKQWLLNQQTVLAKSRYVIEGDMNDPCKYLLLFVFAQAS